MDRKAKQSRNERVWGRRLADQQARGLSAAAWCRKKGVPYSSFMCWKRRLRESGGGPESQRPLFQELVLAGPGPESAPIEVCLPSGLSIRVPAGAVRQCYMWVYRGDETAPFTVHDFQETRGRDGPEALLKPFRGYLQSDGYTVYESLAKSEMFSFKRAGCMAHARRKFVEAHEAKDPRAAEAVALFGELYAVEKQLADVDEAERTDYRRKHAGPVMKRLKTWLQERLDVLPKSALGTAIGYMLDNWGPLEAYLHDARIPIDNNAVERAIRPIAVGRRNWLFMGSPRGGRAAAVFFTLLESCEQNGHNPWTYMTDILTRLPSTPADDLPTLLPDTWKPASEA